MESVYSVWAMYDILEVTRNFLNESVPSRTSSYLSYGLDMLSVKSLAENGLSKIIKIPQNIVEFPQSSLTAENLTFEKLANSLGEKCKMGVTDYLDPKKKINVQMKQWRQIWNKGYERQHTIMVPNYEISKSPLASLVRVPSCIREIDIIHKLWPKDLRSTGSDYPKVGLYLSMVPASAFTHFNLDSGGSSVWYNVVRGEQIIYLVPPTEKNLASFKVCSQFPSHIPYFVGMGK
jgi:F-box/leucine-rich repeat protein 10/11